MTGSEGVRVAVALDPFEDRQQGGVQVAGPGRIPRLPCPAGKVAAGDQSAGVVGGLELVRGWGVGQRTGRGPRPHPPPSLSSRRVLRGRSRYRGSRVPGPARGWAAGRRTGRGPRPHPPHTGSSGRLRRGHSRCPGARARRNHRPHTRRRSPETGPGPVGKCRGGCRNTRGTARAAACRRWSGQGRPGHAAAAPGMAATSRTATGRRKSSARPGSRRPVSIGRPPPRRAGRG